jgi:hypothetical protein
MVSRLLTVDAEEKGCRYVADGVFVKRLPFSRRFAGRWKAGNWGK